MLATAHWGLTLGFRNERESARPTCHRAVTDAHAGMEKPAAEGSGRAFF